MDSGNTSPGKIVLNNDVDTVTVQSAEPNVQRVVPTLRVSPTPVGGNLKGSGSGENLGQNTTISNEEQQINPTSTTATAASTNRDSNGASVTVNLNPDQDDMKRYCWVCFATDEDDLLAQWVKPCRCRGTTKWVHQACIQRWIDEKQKGNTAAKVTCPQCNTEYTIFTQESVP